ncbi:MAG TPA: glycosyltransferase family 4 protein [Acidimicrobiia bacterium]|jgi:glycosyltransferase involved in cell wall biosynthesis
MTLAVLVVAELEGGVGVYGRNLIRGLDALGVDVRVLTPTPDTVTVGKAFGVPRHSGRGRWLPQASAFAREVRSHSRDVDVVHVTDARYAAFFPKVHTPLVGTMNDYFYAITGWLSGEGTRGVYRDWRARHAYYNILRTAERRTLRRYERIICISSAVTTALASRYGLSPNRLPVVHYGIDYLDAPVAPFTRSHPVVLFAGGNFQRKGLAVLLEAMPRVLLRHPTGRLIVVGDSRDTALIRTLSARLGISSNVEFVGQVDYTTLYRYYRTADVFCMPSLMEAFGIPFLEAMHCQVPVIASDAPGPMDYLRDGENCLIARAGDVDALADCLNRVIENPNLQRALRNGGAKTAATATVERMASETLQVYEAATRNASPMPPSGRNTAG